MVAVVSPTVSPWCRAFSQTIPNAIQTAWPYRSTLHAANPSAAFGIDCYCVPGTLRRGLRNVLRYGATKHRLQHPDFVVNHSGTVSHLLILLSVFSPQRSSQTPPVCLFRVRWLALVAWRIKQKTLECLVPGSGSLMLLTARSTWTLFDHRSRSHGYIRSVAMLAGHPDWDMCASCWRVTLVESS